MKLHREIKITQNPLKKILLPMEELLIHEECGNIDEEMQRALNLEFEAIRKKIVFEDDIGKKRSKSLNRYFKINKGSNNIHQKTWQESVNVFF